MLIWLEAREALVKQIRNGELVESLIDRGDSYFRWLQRKGDITGPLSSMLADTEFVSLYKLDDVLKEKAKEEVRMAYAEEMGENDKEVETIVKSIRGDCCLFEVILCLAFSLNEMFEDLDCDDGPSYFFKILLKNAELDHYDEEDFDVHPDAVKEYWKKKIDCIILREYETEGVSGGLFGAQTESISLWKQMNDWVDLHTNEDGEWVD